MRLTLKICFGLIGQFSAEYRC